jgi:hypothetical protein
VSERDLVFWRNFGKFGGVSLLDMLPGEGERKKFSPKRF